MPLATFAVQGYDKPFKENGRLWVTLYFIAMIVVLSIFYINLFVGIVIDVYTYLDETESMKLLSCKLREWKLICR